MTKAANGEIVKTAYTSFGAVAATNDISMAPGRAARQREHGLRHVRQRYAIRLRFVRKANRGRAGHRAGSDHDYEQDLVRQQRKRGRDRSTA